MAHMTEIILFYLSAYFTVRKPSAGKAARLIENEGWKANHPKPGDIRQLWRPAPKLTVESDPDILKSVSKQKWKGLKLKDFVIKCEGFLT